MGLDTTHDCWHGSYSSFGTFRKELAKSIGEDYENLLGLGGSKTPEQVNHPINPLLFHSDCDGELSVEECESIVQGIDMILEGLKPREDDETEYGFRGRLIQFKEGCQEAISLGEKVEFH
jgi:hypothetical protein